VQKLRISLAHVVLLLSWRKKKKDLKLPGGGKGVRYRKESMPGPSLVEERSKMARVSGLLPGPADHFLIRRGGLRGKKSVGGPRRILKGGLRQAKKQEKGRRGFEGMRL